MDDHPSLTELRDLNNHLEAFITEGRREKIQAVLGRRHRYITVVLEDIFQPHNASAVLRSCDAFGVQDVHIIENRNSYTINPDVELGTAQWLDLHKYNSSPANTSDAIAGLKKRGYRILATTPHTNDTLLQDVSLDEGPVALMFGTELSGLSEEAIALADEYVRIPMHGFVESFNISVSAAISLFTLDNKLRNSTSLDWKLPPLEYEEIRHNWLCSSIKKSDSIITQYHRNRIQ